MTTRTIKAVAFEKDGFWIAHCLEYSFVSYARTLEELPVALLQQITAQEGLDLEDGQQPFEGFQRAPERYWEMFKSAQYAPTTHTAAGWQVELARLA